MKALAYISLICLLAFGVACKEVLPPDNPFEGNEPIPDSLNNEDLPQLDLGNFGGLHSQIFRPTCANSGCHDGSFEPDFRTVESAYNTLVFHPIVKNDPLGTYTYRVLPGDLNQSVLWNRLNVDIDGQSGIMPLAVEPDSDWPEKRDDYLQAIEDWIDGGAKDVFGNAPQLGDLPPSLLGMIAFQNGTPLSRIANAGSIQVPGSAQQIDLWFSLSDDQTPIQNLISPSVKISYQMHDFDGQSSIPLNLSTPKNGTGFLGNEVSYQFQAQLDLSGMPSDTTVFVRLYVKDGSSEPTSELPSDGSASYLKTYFSLKL